MTTSLLTPELKEAITFELVESYKEYEDNEISNEKWDGIRHSFRVLCTKEEWKEIYAEVKKLW